ncbi:MAG: hypothetical protein ACJ8GN_09830 [Longimicrobiaceae bacterium]
MSSVPYSRSHIAPVANETSAASVTDDPVSLAAKVVGRVVVETFTDLAAQLGEFAEDFINRKLKAAKQGDPLGPFTVLENTQGIIHLQHRGPAEISKGVSGWVRARVSFANQIRLTPVPVFTNFQIHSFMADLKVTKEGLYEASLGYGFDKGTGTSDHPDYVVGRGIIDLSSLGIRLDIFLGGLSEHGIALALSVGTGGDGRTNKSPIRIPLGATGLALTGISGSFAHNFEPILCTDGPEPKNPTARDYVGWAKRGLPPSQELDIWRPASASGPYRGGLGLNCDIVTMDGFLVRLKQVGFGFLSYGPVIIFGGRGVFLASNSTTIDALACIDFKSGSVNVAAGASVRIPSSGSFRILDATGGVDIFLSTTEPKSSYYNLGSDRAPIQGKFLTDVLVAQVFFMLNLQRVKAGGGLQFAQRFKGGPFTLRAWFGVNGYALLGWNPVQIGAGFGVHGGIEACFGRWCIGLELGGMIEVALPAPRRFALGIRIKLSLPWPLPDIEWSGRVFDYSTTDAPALTSPLLLISGGSSEATKSTAFGALHARSGRQWQLDVPGAPAHVWPDVDLVLPFNRHVTDLTNKVYGPAVLPHEEGGFSVRHRLRKLTIVRLDGMGGTQEVTGFRAMWALGPGGELPALHVPCENPLEWLVPFTSSWPTAHEMPPVPIEQDFGGGPAEYGISASRLFGSVEVAPGQAPVAEFALSYLPGTALDTRFLEAIRIELSLRTTDSPGEPIAVSELQLVLAASEASFSHLVLPSDFSASPAVLLGGLGNGMSLYIIRITRKNGQSFDRVSVESSAWFQCNPGLHVDGESRCYRALLVHRVRWMRGAQTTVDWQERPIFRPGKYRIRVEGDSIATGYGLTTANPWDPYEKDFEVRFPEQLRPYIHFSTIGDSRIFGMAGPSWNPTPFGRGFPSYHGDLATVRFNAPYLSKIFHELKISFAEDPPMPVNPVANTVGESFLPGSILKWRIDHGLPVPNDQEISVALPTGVGISHVRLAFDDTENSNRETLLDEWSFEKSRFSDAGAHLKPKLGTITRIYSALGPSTVRGLPWPTAPAPIKPPVPPGIVLQDWEIPQGAELLVGAVSAASSLKFLQIAERLNLRFGYAAASPLVGLIEPVRDTAVEAVVDQTGRPYALLVRTPEPLDWRRITVEEWTVFGATENSGMAEFTDAPPLTLSARIVPNFDGSQAFIFAQVEALGTTKLTRLPNGAYRMRLRFARQLPELATLTATGTGKPDAISINYQLVYLNGAEWPYSSLAAAAMTPTPSRSI